MELCSFTNPKSFNKNSIHKIILFVTFSFVFTGNFATANVVLYPRDTGIALKNPGMGWMIYYYANSLKYYAKKIDLLSDEQLFSFPGLAVVTFRLSWANLEPNENEFNWQLIDKPAIRFINKGLQIAIRVSNSENSKEIPYATPKWVFDSGAKFHRFRSGYPGVLDEKEGENIEPIFDDRVFIEKLQHFTKALADRYDGNSDVAFIDVGSFGVYGEGHTWSSTKVSYDEIAIKQHIDIYKNSFKKSILVANHNFAYHLQNGEKNMVPIQYAAKQGLGLRDDSILIEKGSRAFYDQDMAQLFYESKPVILETGEYSSTIKKGLWDPLKILEAIKKYRASYIGAYWSPNDYKKVNEKLISDVNKIIGYRISLHKLSYPNIADVKKTIPIQYLFKNTGVARCLKSGKIEFSLYSASGVKVAMKIDQSKDVINFYSKKSGVYSYTSGKLEINLNETIVPGEYWLYVSVVDSSGKAWLEMPMDGKDDDGPRYKLGNILIKYSSNNQ